MQRNVTQRRHMRRAIKATGAACWICGQPIDYTLPYMDPGEFVVDHVVPLSKGGADDLSNGAAAHRACNSAKAARLDGGPTIRHSNSLRRP